MNSLETARDFISRYNFAKARETLEQAKFDESIDCEDLFTLYLKLSKYVPSDRKLMYEYLEYLYKKEKYEIIYKILEQEKFKKYLKIAGEILQLEVLYHLGQLGKFEGLAKEVSDRIISKKLYHFYEKFLEVISGKLESNLSLGVDKLTYYFSINDKLNLKKSFEKLKPKLSFLSKSDKKKLEVLVKRNNGPKTEYQYMFNFYCIKEVELATLIEAIIVGYTNKDLLLKVLPGLVVDEKFSLVNHIKTLKDYSFKEIETTTPEWKSLFLTNVFVSKKSFTSEPVNTFEEVQKILKMPVKQVREADSVFTPKKYICSEYERQLIEELEEDTKDVESLIISFYQMELYTLCSILIERLNKSKNYYYLKSLIQLELGDYADAILTIHDAFENEDIDEGNIEFLNIKKEAFNRIMLKSEIEKR